MHVRVYSYVYPYFRIELKEIRTHMEYVLCAMRLSM